MIIEQVRKVMVSELDSYAKEYMSSHDDDIRKIVADEFKHISRGYNALLKQLFGYDAQCENRIVRRITKYINERNAEGWE